MKSGEIWQTKKEKFLIHSNHFGQLSALRLGGNSGGFHLCQQRGLNWYIGSAKAEKVKDSDLS